MRRVMGAALLAASLAVAVSPAVAQGGQGRGGRGQGGMFGGGGMMLLRIPEVQTELKMTPPQIEKLQAKGQEMQEKMRELFQGGGGQNATQEERMALMAKMQEMQAKAVADILDTKQMKRFRELEIQQMGPNAVNRPEIAKELGVTEEQKNKMREIQRAQGEAMREIFQGAQGGGGFTPEMREKMQALQKSTQEKQMAVLTPEQQKKLKAMGGEPFKFPAFGPGQGRRPGGNPPSA